MSACTLFPLLFEAAIPDTLAELMDRVEDELTPKIDAGATAEYWERNSLRTTCRHLATILGAPIDIVQIEQIAELTSEDYSLYLLRRHRPFRRTPLAHHRRNQHDRHSIPSSRPSSAGDSAAHPATLP